jgi:hypothetical protein
MRSPTASRADHFLQATHLALFDVDGGSAPGLSSPGHLLQYFIEPYAHGNRRYENRLQSFL